MSNADALESKKMFRMMLTSDMGNNESVSRGIVDHLDGTFTAMTSVASKRFQTLNGAGRWFVKHSGAEVSPVPTKCGAFTKVTLGKREVIFMGTMGAGEAMAQALEFFRIEGN